MSSSTRNSYHEFSSVSYCGSPGLAGLHVVFPLCSGKSLLQDEETPSMEVIEDGLLSPNAIANKAANHIKRNGLRIFKAVLQSLGRSVLLPFSSRIVESAAVFLANRVHYGFATCN
jgi:hypothetical protein